MKKQKKQIVTDFLLKSLCTHLEKKSDDLKTG